ncbi:MAG: NAD-dependent epimerase/dehydratase family protein [Dehalococcoidia bacterium]|nr:NAD-dependent epimerase/dehydratase family protein [Dehalococcoidia bacterium]
MPRTVVVTGGAGFIGSNVAAAHLAEGDRVIVIDNLSRAGAERNWQWLGALPGDLIRRQADVRDMAAVRESLAGADIVYHLAAQVAVTTSVADPRSDFEINALGALNVLEAVREAAPNAIVLFASTNKVYGGMEETEIVVKDGRYDYAALPNGVSETQQLDFHSPYGCSKGAADQYVRDYSRIYGLKTVVFRQSCVYGRRQFGNEDQGWVAHFLRRALARAPVTIFGDGRQARDLLWIDDLVRCYRLAIDRIDTVSGQVFNIGGGRAHVASLLEVLAALETLLGYPIERTFGDWRPGDQRVYISDIGRARAALGWAPTVGVADGLARLLAWTREEGS